MCRILQLRCCGSFLHSCGLKVCGSMGVLCFGVCKGVLHMIAGRLMLRFRTVAIVQKACNHQLGESGCVSMEAGEVCTWC